jgi:HEXXH motif-containing protein
MVRAEAKIKSRVDRELPLAAILLPGVEAGESLAADIAAENACEIIRRLQQQAGLRALLFESGIGELFRRWLNRANPGIEVCWHKAFSNVLLALRSGEEEEKAVVRAVTALALHLNVAAEPGVWTSDGAGRHRALWDAWLLPEYDRISVQTDGHEATLTLDDKLGLQFVRNGRQWRPVGAGPEQLHRVSIGGQGMLLMSKAGADGYRSGSQPATLESISSENAERWHRASCLIESSATAYARWIGNAVRQVAVLEPTPGTVHSGSDGDRYGFICGSDQASASSTAEVLVHEAAHQYFLILRRLGPVDDGTDRSLYHSPLVNRGRPLDRILFGFHACANILGFYRACMATDALDKAYFLKNEPVVVDQLRQLGEPLRSNPALTPIGRALFEPWADIV